MLWGFGMSRSEDGRSRGRLVAGTCVGLMLVVLAACSEDDPDRSGSATSTAAQTSTTPTEPESTAPGSTVPGSAVTTAPASTAPVPSTVVLTSDPPPAAVISVAVQPGTGSDFEGALQDVSSQTCEPGDGVWTAGGDVTNPTDASVGYRIYVSFLDASGDTRGLLQVDVPTVAPAETTGWSGSLALTEPDLTCVLRVERAPSP